MAFIARWEDKLGSIPAGAYAVNTPMLGTPIIATNRPNIAEQITFSLVVSVPCVMQVTFNNSNYEDLLSGQTIPANQLFEIEIDVDSGDQINFQTRTIGGTTIVRGVINSKSL